MRYRRLVILESPFRGKGSTKEEVDASNLANIAYARLCVRDSVFRGEAPIASHLLYTQPTILNDDIPAERLNGIECGLSWVWKSDYVVFYTDLGWSQGMLCSLHEHCFKNCHPFKLRSLGGKTEIKLPESTKDEHVERRLLESMEA